MAYRYGHPDTSYNGILMWMRRFEDIREMNPQDQYNYVKSIIEKFIRYNGENIRNRKDCSIDIFKASNLIQTRWSKFIKWYKEEREDINA